MEVDAAPETEYHHHRRTGHSWLDITLAVSAMFISLVSLFLALQHGRVLEKMVQADTWAFVTAGFSNYDPDLTPHPRLIIVNKGVGPAQVQTLEVFYNGTPQPSRRSLIRSILKPADPNYRPRFFESDVIGGVLTAKEEVNFLDFPASYYTPDEYATIRGALDKLEFRICYCSVLGECSVLDTRKPPPTPIAVKACPVPEVPFRDE
jgi:hypothetical protein